MKKIFNKIWTLNFGAIFTIFLITFIFARVGLYKYEITNFYLINQMMLGMTNSYSIIYVFSTLITVIMITIAVRVYYSLFGILYSRIYQHGNLFMVELPINRTDFSKFVLIFASICNIVVGCIRLLYFADYMLVQPFETTLILFIKAVIAIIAFMYLKKYVLKPRSVYPAFIGMAIPFAVVIILF